MSEILERVDVLAGRRLIYVGDIRKLTSGKWLVERFELTGESPRRLESLELSDNSCLRAASAVGLFTGPRGRCGRGDVESRAAQVAASAFSFRF